MLKKLANLLLILSVGLIASCATRSPEPLATNTLVISAEDDIEAITKIREQNEIFQKDLDIDLYTAIALAIENNKDLKVKLFETALADRQIEEIKFDMLPAMSANAGYTGSDKYQSTTSATVTTGDTAGAMGSSYSTSRDRDVLDTDIGFTWNALDFGLSYIRAGQSADRYLIAKEIEKKSSNNIAKDVIKAYWNALSAQKLIKKYDPLIVKVDEALNDSRKIEEMLLQKPMDALLYQKELLDIKRALITQRQTLINAKIDLGGLMGLLPDQKYTLVPTSQPINVLDMKMKHMEKHALVNRAELMENRYQERISVSETKAGIRSLLPSFNFNANYTSSTNDYLQNKQNFEYGSSVGANLLNVFRAPYIREVNEANTAIIREQRLALSMVVLSQVHLANIDFQMSMEEYETADRYFSVSKKIANQVRNAQKIARFGELELIREEASSLVAELRKDIAFSKMQHAVAQVYTSVGVDITTKENMDANTELFAKEIQDRFKGLGKKYVAKVFSPIQKQNPVAKSLNDTFDKFVFAKNTFKLQGKGQIQYTARLTNNQPLPNWIDFLPTQRAFLVDRQDKGDVHELDIIVNARNINTAVDDKFTLVVDLELKKEKDLAKKQKAEEEKRLKAQKLKEEKDQKKAKKLAKAKKLKEEKQLKAQKLKEKKAKEKAEKLAKQKAKELEKFDLYERATVKDGKDLKLFSEEEIIKMITKQDRKNDILRKKLERQNKILAKKKAKEEKIKNIKVKSDDKSLIDLIKDNTETRTEVTKKDENNLPKGNAFDLFKKVKKTIKLKEKPSKKNDNEAKLKKQETITEEPKETPKVVEKKEPLITNKEDTLAKIVDYLDKGEDVPHIYLRALEKDGEFVQLFSDEAIQKMIEKQEKRNKKIRKKIQKLKEKQAKKKAKSLKMSKGEEWVLEKSKDIN